MTMTWMARPMLRAGTAGLLACAAGCASPGLDQVPAGVVMLFVLPDAGDMLGTGSGFLVNRAGVVVTNHHVVEPALQRPGRILLLDDRRARELVRTLGARDMTDGKAFGLATEGLPEGRVVWADEKQDLAIVAAKAPVRGTPLLLAPGAQVLEGDRVWSLGFPGINLQMGPASLVTLDRRPGEITSRHVETRNNRALFSTSLVTLNGMSGGPAVNACGEVVGVNFGGYTRISTKERQVTGIETIKAFIQVDTLLPALDKNRIAYSRAAVRCPSAATLVPTPRDPLLIGGVAAALLMGGIGVGLGATARGRAAARAARDSVSRRLSRDGSARRARGRDGPVPAPVPVLHGLSGEYEGLELEMGTEPVAIGRDPRVSQLVLGPAAPHVSGRHCAVWFDAAKRTAMLEDLWSTNGTFLADGRRLEGGIPQTLGPAEPFSLGGPDVRFEVRY